MRTIFLIVLALLCFINPLYGQGSTDTNKQPKVRKGQKNGKKGAYTEWDMQKKHPYTMFNNANEMSEYDFRELIAKLRIEVRVSGGEYFEIYKQIYDDATDFSLNYHHDSTGVNARSQKAKHCAFVYLIGANKMGNEISGSTRDAYRDKAIEYLKTCNYKVPFSEDKYQWRCRDLIHYLEAYDLLMAAKRLDSLYVNDDDMKMIKNRLHRATKNLYQKGLIAIHHNNNHTLAAAAALGVASIVLNDCKAYWWEDEWHPDAWARTANNLIVRTLFNSPGQMSSYDGKVGYAEGPHYFTYSFECLSVFFRAYDNAVRSSTHSKTYDKPGIFFPNQVANNYLYDERVENIYKWYVDQLMPDSHHPQFDATLDGDMPYFLGIYGKPELLVYKPSRAGILFTWADYIASGVHYQPNILVPQESFVNETGGEAILRWTPANPIDAPEVWLRCASEKGEAVHGGRHEYPDASSFILYAGFDGETGEVLAFHPGYLGYDNRKLINKDDQCNLITVENRLLGISTTTTGPNKKNDDGSVDPLVSNASYVNTTVSSDYQSTNFERHITLHSETYPYYFIRDVADRDAILREREYTWNLNGNGNSYEGTCSTYYNDQITIWNHPCNERNTMGLAAYVRVLDNDGKVLTPDYNLHNEDDLSNGKRPTIHLNRNLGGSLGYYQTNLDGTLDGNAYGNHTRLQVTQLINKSGKVQFTAVLYPYRCTSGPPNIDSLETWDGRGGFRIQLGGFDSLVHVHQTGDEGAIQSISNPFGDTVTPIIRHNSEYVFSSWSKYPTKYFKNCLAETHFRTARFENGNYLIQTATNDTTQDTLISSNQVIDAGFELIGKYRYRGTVRNNSGSDATVMFFLPDVEAGVEMEAAYFRKDNLLESSYNDTFRKIIITIPAGVTEFLIKPANPCILSCFFPPTYVTIDTLFDFNTGTTEVLGHDLDIVQPEGHLQITKASKMSICEDYILANKDSITIWGLWDEGYADLPVHTVYDESGEPVVTSGELKVTDRLASKRSMIIVNDKAALVLEPGSYTHVGANATILVRKGGTLLIKDGAVLEIGDYRSPGWGEVIIEDGAFLCVEDSARIRFYSDTTDSTDKNVFYVGITGDDPATAGVNTLGGRGAFTSPLGEYSSNTCVQICFIKTLNVYNSVYNKEFGWSNINYPEAIIDMRDTFCYGEPIDIDASRTLNETKYYFDLCTYNVGTQSAISPLTYLPATAQFGLWDSIRVGKKTLEYDPEFTSGFHYRVRLIVKNDCGDYDTISRVFFISPTPQAVFTVNDTTCPGFETITVDGSSSLYGAEYVWTISQGKDYSQIHVQDEDFEPNEASYVANWAVDTIFSFPDYRVYGNSTYAVSLTVTNICGIAEYSDSVYVPLSAQIHEIDSLYYTPTTISVENNSSNADGWCWIYESVLDSTNWDISDQLDSTTRYILKATMDECIDFDTLDVELKLYAHAGPDQHICFGDSVKLGDTTLTLLPTHRVRWFTGIENDSILCPWAYPTVTTTYTIHLIHTISGDTIESDDVTIFVDTIPEVAYSTSFIDTLNICFTNLTDPTSATTGYLWIFEDGPDSSMDINTCHQFPYFTDNDTAFSICLIATNLCGSFTECDTLWIDSTGLLSEVQDSSFESKKGISGLLHMTESLNPEFMTIYPNPFDGFTRVSISMPDHAGETQIIVNDILGHVIMEMKLAPEKRDIVLATGNLKPGVYLCNLVVNGKVISSLRIVKE